MKLQKSEKKKKKKRENIEALYERLKIQSFVKSIIFLLHLSESWTQDLRHSSPVSYLYTMEA